MGMEAPQPVEQDEWRTGENDKGEYIDTTLPVVPEYDQEGLLPDKTKEEAEESRTQRDWNDFANRN